MIWYPSIDQIQFDCTAMAEVFESMTLKFDDLTEHQKDARNQCKNVRSKRVRIEGLRRERTDFLSTFLSSCITVANTINKKTEGGNILDFKTFRTKLIFCSSTSFFFKTPGT